MKYQRQTIKTKLENLPFASKIMLIIICMIVIRIGSIVPLPFVNTDYMKNLLGNDGLGFINSVTGGSFYYMSFFALSISPYITASIIIQLLTIVLPRLEALQKDGKSGRDELKKITAITAVVLALIQSAGMAVGLGHNGLLAPYSALTVIGAILIWTAGAGALIGLGEFISMLNIGNGISIILAGNILASFPSDIRTVWDLLISGRKPFDICVNAVLVLTAFLLIIAACIVLSQTSRKIRVTQSRKITGYADSTFPIPLNTCSVMPVIFASSLLSIPVLISRFSSVFETGIPGHIIKSLNSSYWFLPDDPVYTVGALVYAGLTTFFTYFYLGIAFNASEIAMNMKKSGTVIPGIRPGAPTADYIARLSTKVALFGNALMTGLILIMHLICNASGLGNLSIAGTSILICVNVIIEEKKQLKSMQRVKRYGKNMGLIPQLKRLEIAR